MEIKILARNTLLLAGPKVLKFILGIFRAKLIAIFLGISGAGIISQLQTTVQEMKTLTLSSLPEGMVKLIAKDNATGIKLDKISSIIKTYLIIIIPLSVIVTILGYIFSNQITTFIFGDLEYKLYFQIGFISLPILIFSSSFVAILQAFKEIKSIAFSGMLIILLNFILFVPLLYFFQILGGVIYVTLSFVTMFLVHFYFMREKVLKKHGITVVNIKNAVLKRIYFKELFSFMGFGLIAGTYYFFTEITSRSIVVGSLGIDKLGIYSPITSWAGLFVGFILPSLNTYLFPRISEAKDNTDIVGVMNDVIRLMTFLTLPFVIIAVSVREWIIPLFYSNEFIESTEYFPYHFAGLIFTVWTFSFTYIFAPTGRLRSFLIMAILVHSMSLALVYFLVPSYGLYGYMAKFTITPIFSFFLYLVYWSFEIHFRLKRDNLRLILFSIFSLLVLLVLKDTFLYLQLAGILLLSLQVMLLNMVERQYIINRLKKIKKHIEKNK